MPLPPVYQPPHPPPPNSSAAYTFGRFVRERPKTTAILSVVTFVAVIGLLILKSAGERERAEIEVREAERRATEDSETVRRNIAIRAEQQRLAAEKADAAAQANAADVEEAKRRSAKASTSERAQFIKACVHGNCKPGEIEALIAGAPPKDRHRAELVRVAEGLGVTAKEKGRDGPKIDDWAIGALSGTVARDDVGLAVFGLLPSTSVAEAKKDPGAARGKVLRVSGNVVEIRANGSVTEGAIATGDLDFVRFVTGMSTKTVFAQSWASFTGVFVQEFNYPNVSGGETRALLVVGAFELPENRLAPPPVPSE